MHIATIEQLKSNALKTHFNKVSKYFEKIILTIFRNIFFKL